MQSLLFVFFVMLGAISSTPSSYLQNFIDNTQTVKAKFSQTVTNDQNIEIEHSSGDVYISRPNQFRWNYTAPYLQSIIADGTHIWFYDEDIEQVTVKKQSKILDKTPASFLSGSNQWQTDFTLKKHEILENKQEKFTLIPKDEESYFSKITLLFKSKQLNAMILLDKAQQTTHISFSELQINTKLSTQLFTFKPPKNVDVIGEL